MKNKLHLIDKSRYIFTEDGRIYSKRYRNYLTPYLRTDGYLATTLKLIDGTSEPFLLHMVIAYIFCEIPTDVDFDLLQVDHIIPVSQGGTNEARNLRWVTPKENMNNPLTKQKIDKSRYGRKQTQDTIDKRVSKNRGKKRTEQQKKNISEGKYKPILQYSKDGQFIREWESGLEIISTLGYSKGNISECCNNHRKSAYGYVWRFKE